MANPNPTPTFKKAEKSKAWFKIAICGPSGSGKTYSALALASGMGKKIALIDTENSSAKMYADLFDFDHIDLNPPYLVDKYSTLMDLAIKEKYEVLIIDSISHAWAGAGGLLQKKEQLDQSGRGNSYTNWASITKEQEKFVSKLISLNIHLICTMRSKQEHVIDRDDNGKQVVRKKGMAPIQRDGIEYEFTTVFDIAMSHLAEASKDRTKLFDGQHVLLSKQTGETLISWLESQAGELNKPEANKEREINKDCGLGASNDSSLNPSKEDPNPQVQLVDFSPISKEQAKRLFAIGKSCHWTPADIKNYLSVNYGFVSTSEIQWNYYNDICKHIANNPNIPKTKQPIIEDEPFPFEEEGA